MLEKKKLAGEGRTRRQDCTFTEAKVRCCCLMVELFREDGYYHQLDGPLQPFQLIYIYERDP